MSAPCGSSPSEAGQRPDLAIESFHRAIERDQPATILGEGSQRCDLTHVSGVARAVELVIKSKESGFEAPNVGTGVNYSGNVLDQPPRTIWTT